MLLRCLFVFFLLADFSLFGAVLKLDLLNVGSHSYSNVTVLGANTTDLYFTHSGGISNVKLRQLDPQLQKHFDFDPKAAEQAERQQELDDLKFHYSISSNVIAKAVEAAVTAKKTAATSEFNIADPFTESSLIGKPAPEMSAQKWLGSKPELKGKCALIYFWAPWSIPSRRFIPDLNDLQKKYGEQVSVVGVTAESQVDVETMPGTRVEFPCAIDPQAKMFAAVNVRSLPCVLLIDPAGIVRYLGHPAALNDRAIEALIAPKSE
jgi:cytochrome c biogenesis protein CcmG/thiol:disulfide interchange protein DsbE